MRPDGAIRRLALGSDTTPVLQSDGRVRRQAKRSMRRLWCVDDLLLPRAFMRGPKWQRHFGVENRPIKEVNPPWAHLCRAGRKFVLTFTFEEDIRERVLEELRPGVFAMWVDPYERFPRGSDRDSHHRRSGRLRVRARRSG